MAEITGEEFSCLINDLVYSAVPDYGRLVCIVEKTIKPTVYKWAKTSRLLDGEAEDLLQEIHIKIIKNIVTKFLLRDGTLNEDPNGLKNWIFRVAENTKNDYCRLLNRYNGSARADSTGSNLSLDNTDAPIEVEDKKSADVFEAIEKQQMLQQAFKAVIYSGAGVYKVLTWLAQSLIVIEKRTTRIMAKNELLYTCADLTLNQMYSVVLTASHKIPWLTLSENEMAVLLKALKKDYNGAPIGECTYKELFMKKGGSASVSDWVNKLDQKVRSQIV